MSWIITGTQKNSFTPADITTALWLDAADASTITESGGAVSQWDDKSGNNRHVSQATAADQPTYLATGFNSLPTIGFDGSSDFLKNASYEPTGAVTCFFAAERTSGSANGVLLLVKTSTIFEIVSAPGTDSYLDFTFTGAGSSSPKAIDVSGSTTSPFVLGVQYDGSGTANSDYSARFNGESQAITSSGPVGHVSETGFTIGKRSVQSISPFNGKISELIFINSQSPLVDQQKIEGYLAHRWGLTANLPADHPYKTAVPMP
jgi:hypothetical protein